jgi:hypothetical protein
MKHETIHAPSAVTPVTNIKISDPKLGALVATAASGNWGTSDSGHPSQLIAVNVVNVSGKSLVLNQLYTIAANSANGVITKANMQYDHKQDASDGTLYAFYEVK